MANRLTMADIHAIQRLHRSEYSGREIAALLQIDRGTVAKYVAAGSSGSAVAAVAAGREDCQGPDLVPRDQNPPNAPSGSPPLRAATTCSRFPKTTARSGKTI